MQDLLRADYYMDRAMRGKFEVESSKTRELSDQNYKRKKEIRQEQWKQLPVYDQAACDSKINAILQHGIDKIAKV